MTVATALSAGVIVDIGGLPIRLRSADTGYLAELERRFAGFIGSPSAPILDFTLTLEQPDRLDPDDEVRVAKDGGTWTIDRSDCRAAFDFESGRGTIRQPAHPYATDSVLRIVHTLLLAERGGILMHAASAQRNGRTFLFFGPSGAGKSTMVSMAPPDVTVLSEEVAYIRRDGVTYSACGTPFTGELGRRGENTSAPLAGLFRLVQGDEDRIEPIAPAEAVRLLLQCTLCFPGESTVATRCFQAVCDLAARVPVQRLVFRRTPDVWRLIA
jgi:hypothetical protein